MSFTLGFMNELLTDWWRDYKQDFASSGVYFGLLFQTLNLQGLYNSKIGIKVSL